MTNEYLNKLREEKANKISEAYRDENDSLVRNVDGKEIKQIEEKTEADRRLNEAINLWRMRRK